MTDYSAEWIEDCLSATESAFSEGGYGGFVCAEREWR